MALIIEEFGALNKVVMELFVEFFVLSLTLFGIKKVDGGKDNRILFLLMILHFIILFGVFGFNEIFIVNLCGLDYYTKKMITERAETDKFQESQGLILKEEDLLEMKKANKVNNLLI